MSVQHLSSATDDVRRKPHIPPRALFTRNADGSAKPLGEICRECLPDGTTALMDGGHSRLVSRVETHAKKTVRLLNLLRDCESLSFHGRSQSDYDAAVAAARRAP